MIPHEGGFAIALVEKIEDLVVILLLPIVSRQMSSPPYCSNFFPPLELAWSQYFALSGLKTDLGLLNTGKVWGYTILLIVVAFLGKFIGCAVAAKFSRFNNREAGAVGALMSCKGLVELIVLNIGLQAGILDTKLFSMFVVCLAVFTFPCIVKGFDAPSIQLMAIILTCITTPLTIFIYPASIRVPHEGALLKTRADAGSETDSGKPGVFASPSTAAPSQELSKTKFAVLLERIDHLPAIMTLVQLLQTSSTTSRRRTIRIDALRLVELSDRASAVMRGSEASELLRRDALVKVFEMFGRLNRIVVSSALSVVPQNLYAQSVIDHAKDVRAELVVLPWTAGPPANVGATLATGVTPTDLSDDAHAGGSSGGYNPFQGLFSSQSPSSPAIPNATETAVLYSQFIRQVFSQSSADVALLVDRVDDVVGAGTPSTSATIDTRAVDGHHLFLPFIGGPDDRLGLTLLVQLVASNPSLSATGED